MNDVVIEHIKIDTPDGRALQFDVDTARNSPACFALSIRKSGSSIFSNIVTAIAKNGQRNVVDVPHIFFENGMRPADWNASDVLSKVMRRGNVYVGFRDAPTAIFDDPVFRSGRKILLVRDPRDALVSEYFSNAYSHSLPKTGEDSVISVERDRALQVTVEEYVLQRVEFLNRTAAAYSPIIDRPNLLIQRYEDVIFDKRAWIRDIADFLNLPAGPGFIERVVGWADVRPDAEDPTKFIRKVAPGDHLDKLSPDAIRAVNAKLDPIWGKLGYDI